MRPPFGSKYTVLDPQSLCGAGGEPGRPWTTQHGPSGAVPRRVLEPSPMCVLAWWARAPEAARCEGGVAPRRELALGQRSPLSGPCPGVEHSDHGHHGIPTARSVPHVPPSPPCAPLQPWRSPIAEGGPAVPHVSDPTRTGGVCLGRVPLKVSSRSACAQMTVPTCITRPCDSCGDDACRHQQGRCCQTQTESGHTTQCPHRNGQYPRAL